MFRTLLFCIAGLTPLLAAEEQLPKTLSMKITATYRHDNKAFTQGLFYSGGFLYESTGNYGASTLRQVEPKTGQVRKRVSLPKQFFAEGAALVDDKIYQLTWQEGYCFVYDKETFQLTQQHRYRGEGWGLTFDGTHLILSDGSDTLTFYEPKTFKKVRTVKVAGTPPATKKTQPVKNLNELEYIRGEVWANIWHSHFIVRIDPKTGSVNGWIDCAGFVPEEFKAGQTENVLNGIAFDAATDTVYVTGKNWAVLYEIKLEQRDSHNPARE
ncbi:MAG: glutaminyl-peptide cyclotransferase [Planctomycetaceae bacterium]|jgi:glutamine cyclotransferase|nr:glutaminyl-peptide cyclotransferase [Planctomycetaceae bacterium]